MLDSQSRKILKYIKKNNRASFDEILKNFPNQDLTAYMLIYLNMEQYTICVEKRDRERDRQFKNCKAKVMPN